MNAHLSPEQLKTLLTDINSCRPVEVVRIFYMNGQEIRRTVRLSPEELRELVLTSQEDGHQLGGDLEVALDSHRVLVGHHDGLYWIEEPKANATVA